MIPGSVIRIILRYFTLPLIAFGLIGEAEASMLIEDPEMIQWASLIIGGIMPFLVEGWYVLAKRLRWPT